MSRHGSRPFSAFVLQVSKWIAVQVAHAHETVDEVEASVVVPDAKALEDHPLPDPDMALFSYACAIASLPYAPALVTRSVTPAGAPKKVPDLAFVSTYTCRPLSLPASFHVHAPPSVVLNERILPVWFAKALVSVFVVWLKYPCGTPSPLYDSAILPDVNPVPVSA